MEKDCTVSWKTDSFTKETRMLFSHVIDLITEAVNEIVLCLRLVQLDLLPGCRPGRMDEAY